MYSFLPNALVHVTGHNIVYVGTGRAGYQLTNPTLKATINNILIISVYQMTI